MTDLQFWEIGPGDERLARKIKSAYDQLLKRPPRGYTFTFYGDTDFVPSEHDIHYIVGHTLDDLLGYASCIRSPPNAEIGSISHIDGLDLEPPLQDIHGKTVTRANLQQYEGYNRYTGKGPVLHIELMEIFKPYEGIGSKLLDFIKARGYELIELQTYELDACNFFERRGFVDSDIDGDEGNQQILVWNNPAYTCVI